jgi:hypothetical protein
MFRAVKSKIVEWMAKGLLWLALALAFTWWMEGREGMVRAEAETKAFVRRVFDLIRDRVEDGPPAPHPERR